MDSSLSLLLTFNNPNITALWFERCPHAGLRYWTFGLPMNIIILGGSGHLWRWEKKKEFYGGGPFGQFFLALSYLHLCFRSEKQPCLHSLTSMMQPTKPSETVRWNKSLFLKVARSGFWSYWDNSNKDNRSMLAVIISWLPTFPLCCAMAVQGLCKPHSCLQLS